MKVEMDNATELELTKFNEYYVYYQSSCLSHKLYINNYLKRYALNLQVFSSLFSSFATPLHRKQYKQLLFTNMHRVRQKQLKVISKLLQLIIRLLVALWILKKIHCNYTHIKGYLI